MAISSNGTSTKPGDWAGGNYDYSTGASTLNPSNSIGNWNTGGDYAGTGNSSGVWNNGQLVGGTGLNTGGGKGGASLLGSAGGKGSAPATSTSTVTPPRTFSPSTAVTPGVKPPFTPTVAPPPRPAFTPGVDPTGQGYYWNRGPMWNSSIWRRYPTAIGPRQPSKADGPLGAGWNERLPSGDQTVYRSLNPNAGGYQDTGGFDIRNTGSGLNVGR